MIELFGFWARCASVAPIRERSMHFSGTKRLALLAYLVTRFRAHGIEGRHYSRFFWPNSTRVHARTSLRNALYVLRQILGDDVLRNRGDEEISVDPARLETDLGKLWTAIKHGRMEDDSGQLPRRAVATGLFAFGQRRISALARYRAARG